MHVRETTLTAAVDGGHVDVGRAIEFADGVSDARERAVEINVVDPPIPCGDLLDGAAGRGDAKQMHRAADLSGEIEEAAVRRPAWRTRIEIPIGGEISGRAEAGGLDVQVLRSAVVHLAVDDNLRADRPLV